jgi:alginate O-acetyltransferase complex protein AlgI
MTISQILIFVVFALILGWLTRKFQRVNLLLIASVLAIYWLQPALPLRYLDFYLPTLSIGITVLAWALTATLEKRKERESLISGGIILALVLALALTRYLGLDLYLLPARPPAITQVLIILGILLLFTFYFLRRKEATSNNTLWAGFTTLLLFFIVLKTPALSELFSQLWRLLISKQDVALAAANDIHWLGYSYLAFRLLHTIRDRQSGRLPDLSLGEYVTYVIFFPSFSVGPIERIERFIKGLRNVTDPFSDDILNGGQRLAVGLFKKFVVADTLAMISLNATSASQAQSAFGAWILLYAYAFQIYFDFSGYTDIAIGLGQLVGIKLPENFKQPYRQNNLTLFWNNWHMTLTQWFRAYFFNPFARTLRAKRKLSPAMMVLISQLATMTLIGLWHGVTWSFVVWGLWHGLGLFLQNRYSGWSKTRLTAASPSPRAERALSVGGTLLTFHYVALGWIWFVLPDPVLGWQFILRLVGVSA